MAQNKQYEELVRRYLENKASDDELDVFFQLLKTGKLDKYLHGALAEKEGIAVSDSEDEDVVAGSATGKWKYLAAAAVMTGLMGAGSLWYWSKSSKNLTIPVNKYVADVKPGRNHALLKLSSGKVIDLDSGSSSVVHLQSNARLVKSKTGEWVYQSPPGEGSSVIYNTISAPRGAQFPFVLEDGTRVWLNASSSLRFPSSFQDGSREVVLQGEAYFEVAPDSRKSFDVKVGEMTAQVLGTHFNINAYPDESAIRTSLLEGSVRIVQGQTSALLHPGDQARLHTDGTVSMVNDPDAVDAAVAWRTGYFSFDEDDIQTVMRQISRWYNVDIHYEGPVTKAVFGGDIGRDLTLVQVLKVLEKSQVHFRLEGNSLTVLP